MWGPALEAEHENLRDRRDGIRGTQGRLRKGSNVRNHRRSIGLKFHRVLWICLQMTEI